MSPLEICQLIENSRIGTFIRESNYYWMLDGTHVLGLSMSVGAIFWFDLRALGFNMRRVRVSEVYRQISAWMLGGFALMILSGALLFSARATALYSNTFFRIKFAAMAAAGVNALYFHYRTQRGIAAWDTAPVPPPSVRLAGLASLVMWASVIVAGRLMAYTL